MKDKNSQLEHRPNIHQSMIKPDIPVQKSSTQDQETANASSTTYSVATTNCEATPETTPTVEDIEKGNSLGQKSGESILSQSLIKNSAPVIEQDVGLTDTTNKVPMVMVPVTDSQTLTVIPVPALSQLKETLMDTSKNEQQARDLLCWNNGIGTLEGCDLRFRINQLGCLELLDSDDDESENQSTLRQNAISKNSHQSNSNSSKKASTITKTITNTPNFTATNATPPNGTSNAYSKTNDGINNKRPKLESGSSVLEKQISPGSSLLRDGPNMRRPKFSSSNHTPNCLRTSTNNTALQRRMEQYHITILFENLVPKQKLEEIKSNVEAWTMEDVRSFVDSIPGCAGYGELFESQQICGKSLLYLDQRDLLDVINVKLGPAVKIYHAISLLK